MLAARRVDACADGQGPRDDRGWNGDLEYRADRGRLLAGAQFQPARTLYRAGGDRHRRARDRLVHLSCRDVEAAGLKPVLLRKQEPRVTSGNAPNPRLLLSQEPKVATPTPADARCGTRGRKSGLEGRGLSVRVDLGGPRIH